MASSAGSALSLIKATLDLVAERRTGLLDVRSDGLRTRVYFGEGQPLFAEDDAPGESFGRLLVRQGVLANADFVRVIDEMTRAAQGNTQLRFGEVAVGLGVLTEEQVERGLAEQVCGVITRSLQRGESQWSFEPSPPAPKPPRAFSLQINPAIVEALRESADRSKVADLVAARPEELVQVAGPRPAGELRGEAGGAPDETHAARMAAEQAFQRGLALLGEGKNAAATVELGRAAALQPESLEYQLYATWAKARSYREVPSALDQKTLLEIAHKAKKRDPLFAFASYVIGQLAMWSGDDVAAKKWFYEALRLDPASEAGKQVRILARRGAGTPPPPGAEVPSEGEAAPLPAPPPTREEPQSPPAASKPSTPPPARWAGRLATWGALLAMAALVILAVARRSAPGAGLSPVVAPPSGLIPDAAPSVEQERRDAAPSVGVLGSAPLPRDLQTEDRPLAATGQKGPDEGQTGTVRLPARAAGHRIFVDGRRAKLDVDTDGNPPLRLRCGHHVIQIGSGGEPEPIDLPCGGEIEIE